MELLIARLLLQSFPTWGGDNNIPAPTPLHQPLQGFSSVGYVLLNEDPFGQLVHPGKEHHRVPPSASTQGPQLLIRRPPVDVGERLSDRHHQQYHMRSGGAQNGPHAGPLTVQARHGAWRIVRLCASVVVIVFLCVIVSVDWDRPGWGIHHGDTSAVHLRVAHIAVCRLCPGIKDLIPQDGVGCGGFAGLWAPQDEQSTLGGMAAPGVNCRNRR